MNRVRAKIQQAQRSIGIRRYFALSTAVFGVGLTISALLAENERWVDESISDLGIDPQSAMWFNATLVFFGMANLPLLVELRRVLREHTLKPGVLQRSWVAGLVVDSLLVVPFATMGIGLVPYNVNVTVHNACAVSILVIFCANAAVFSLPRFTDQQRVRVTSAAFLAFIAAATLAYTPGPLGYVEYEFILIAAFAIWVYLNGVAFPAIEAGA